VDYIYLDHAATTPIRPEVVDAMNEYLASPHGNASSSHAWGRAARVALEEARERVSTVLGASRAEIIFTGSGTEANNLAILGRWRRIRGEGGPSAVGPLCCSAIEHKSVLGAVEAAGHEGADTILLPVDMDGVVDANELDQVLAASPALVSIQWGNNEIGTIQPVAELASQVRASGATFHTDAVQAFGHVPVRVDEVSCDMLTISPHKFGGPIGVGVLFLRSGVTIDPILHGGGQENGLRPGTSNVASAVGVAVAAELTAAELSAEAERIGTLRDELEPLVTGRIPGLTIPGRGAARLPHVCNIVVAGADRETLLMALDFEGVAASSGSACQTGTVEPSHVLEALGHELAGAASLRLSLGRTTTEAEVREAAERVCRVIERVRAMAA